MQTTRGVWAVARHTGAVGLRYSLRLLLFLRGGERSQLAHKLALALLPLSVLFINI